MLGRGDSSAQAVWQEPSCEKVRGTPAVTFTRDEGKTLTPTEESLKPLTYASVAATGVPNELVASVNETVLRSKDSGCTWSVIGKITPGGSLTRLVGSSGRVYSWAPKQLEDKRPPLFRIDPAEITALSAPLTGSPSGLGVDAKNGDRLRIGGTDGTLYKSQDAGKTWQQVGAAPDPDTYVYVSAFDPNNLNHILVGTARQGAFVTFNGGSTWQQSTGFGSKSEAVNIFRAVMSPTDGDTIWAMGLNISQANSGHPSQGKHIYMSNDGGRTFTPVIDNNPPQVSLINGPTMATPPNDAHILYFVFSKTFGDNPGSYLYKFNSETKQITNNRNLYDSVVDIILINEDPSLIYLGLGAEPKGPH